MAVFADGGFPPNSKFEAPDGPDLGPVVEPSTGEFKVRRGHTLRNEWAEASAVARSRFGGCCGGELAPRPSPIPPAMTEYTDRGDAGDATYRAAQIAHVSRGRTPPSVLIAQSCGTPGGACRVHLGNGNFMMHTEPPTSSDFDPVPILTYNSRSNEPGEFGNGWFNTYKRSVKVSSGPSGRDVTTGMGTVLNYSDPDGSGH